MRRPSVLLADSHRVVVEGLVNLLSPACDIVGVVKDGRALIDAVARLDPDIVVMDVSLPIVTGIDALMQLKKRRARAKVIALTMHQDPAYATRALEAGASGFVLKHLASSELLAAIRDVLKGKTYVTPMLAGEMSSRTTPARSRTLDAMVGLTPRQREILRMLAEGLTAKGIGEALKVSTRTVERNRSKIKEALHLRNQSELLRFALKHGIAIAVTWVTSLAEAAVL